MRIESGAMLQHDLGAIPRACQQKLYNTRNLGHYYGRHRHIAPCKRRRRGIRASSAAVASPPKTSDIKEVCHPIELGHVK